jgi:hypothetical protein
VRSSTSKVIGLAVHRAKVLILFHSDLKKVVAAGRRSLRITEPGCARDRKSRKSLLK